MSDSASLPRIPLAGVIGHPVAHSKSPELFRHWLETYGIAGQYVPLHVHPDTLAEALATLPKLGFVGANVTIPHKLRAMELADIVTDRATLIGAANTLIFRDDGKIHADNTDGYGFIENLRRNAPDWDPAAASAVVLGAGGAARAVIAALLEAGTPHILLSNRTRTKAEALARDFGKKIEVVEWVQAPAVLGDGALVVNTTSLGMAGKPPLRINLENLHADQLVTDLVYNPLRTDLLAAAASKGCRTVDGLGMLLYQAVPGFERWFGRRPDVTDATRDAVLS
ncbi:shikimate 5-dehydrogenase [Pseudooceanicola batsensis HTCC2597]|uniref:Shikimate dehydrogenase (NADP(+)) n=1 Tax=Pseudooceanicola batsensis (strain ATCC BAA-863 / DSM 15984 / KCTC 12145 / HTCC2597) TaxID=252305 RepID=A3TXU5_PSEBH|nr:shikimate dehydrogenase [Pseudooceanicola batsensis]EAQ02979.1 shikimate 5-dehydrogenase [Pseudooceanicola batsensis HTCC2597]